MPHGGATFDENSVPPWTGGLQGGFEGPIDPALPALSGGSIRPDAHHHPRRRCPAIPSSTEEGIFRRA